MKKINRPIIGKAYLALISTVNFETEIEGTWITWAKKASISDDEMQAKVKELRELGFVAFYRNDRIGVKASG